MTIEGWSEKRLSEVAHVTSGGTPSKNTSEYWDNGTVPWIRTTEVQNSLITPDQAAIFISEAGLHNSSAKLFPKGTLLIAMIGQGKTRGQVGLLTFEASTNQNCAAIILEGTLLPEFYFYYFLSQYKNIRGLSNSAGQSNLSGALIKSLRVPVPPKKEQEKIAEVLSTWDKAITTTEKLLINSQQQKKALMQQLLTGKKRLPGFDDEWKEIRLNQIFNRVTDRNLGISSNVVTISAQQGLIRQQEFFKKTVASETLDNYFLLRKGQFAYNKSYSNGYPMGAIKRLNRYEHGVVTTLYICFEIADESQYHSDFFEHLFESGALNRGLKQIAHEGGRAHGLLNVKPLDFFNLKVSIPSYPEQKSIANLLTKADDEVSSFKAQLKALKGEKQALMQQLLTGKRRVKIEEAA